MCRQIDIEKIDVDTAHVCTYVTSSYTYRQIDIEKIDVDTAHVCARIDR